MVAHRFGAASVWNIGGGGGGVTTTSRRELTSRVDPAGWPRTIRGTGIGALLDVKRVSHSRINHPDWWGIDRAEPEMKPLERLDCRMDRGRESPHRGFDLASEVDHRGPKSLSGDIDIGALPTDALGVPHSLVRLAAEVATRAVPE